MKKKYLPMILILILVPIAIISVSIANMRKEEPVTLSLWHNYGGQMKEIMDEMIEEFNGTIGEEEGIYINVTSISGSSTLHDNLVMAANQDPGAPSLPDITTSYPKTALLLAEKGLLTNLEELFTEEELSAYIPRFIEEGHLNGEELYVFPTAKSTEVLFINKTIFDRFAADTGTTLDSLATFEGIGAVSEQYYTWSDEQTPDIANDGKAFYASDSLFNLSLIGCRQLSSNLIKDNKIDFGNTTTEKIWNYYYSSAVKGYTAIFDGYASDLAKTGDIVCSTGSSAGVLFFPSTVTYPDNTTEPAELAILPYPVFENGEKVALQRGAGMCVIKSTTRKEEASGIFLKWFTKPENNLRFVSSTGYLPVTEEAFGDIMLQEIDSITDENLIELLQVFRQMQMSYDFYISPLFDGIESVSGNYEDTLRAAATLSKETYHDLLLSEDPAAAFDTVISGQYVEFSKNFSQ